jgi:hypothetical protein
MMMGFTEQLAKRDQYRVVLVLPWLKMVLAERHGEALWLPRIDVPPWTRAAEQLTSVLLTNWNVRSIVIDFLPRTLEISRCAVIEIRTRNWEFVDNGFRAVSVDDLDETEMTTDERVRVHSLLAGEPQDRGPFSRLGWIDEATDWIRESVSDRGVQFSDEIRQLNAGGTFALIRFGTLPGPAYWLKATGAPNLHEFDITATLAALCPKYLPPLVAMRRDWNAWVMEDAGKPLDRQMSMPRLEGAIVSMADLQKRTVGYAERLLASGATDQRMEVLGSHADEIISYLEEAMDQQASAKAPRLGVLRLREIGTILTDACGAMEKLRIPETVIHNDINRGNILFSESACVFTDWCEAYIGNPFVTFQHLLLLLPSGGDHTEANRATLKQGYKQCWLDSVPSQQIDEAFVLMPLLAVASYLYGRGDWLRSARRYDPHVQSYARSLARHMDREAQVPSLMEALCH